MTIIIWILLITIIILGIKYGNHIKLINNAKVENDKLNKDIKKIKIENLFFNKDIEKLQEEIKVCDEKIRLYDEEIKNYEEEIKKLKGELQKIEDYDNKIKQKKTILNGLLKEEEELRKSIEELTKEENVYDFGLYDFHYDFASSETYKIRLTSIKDKQKELIKNNNVLNMPNMNFGKDTIKLYNDISKMLIRLFNSECDNLFNKVKFNNILSIEEKLLKLKDTINKFGDRVAVSLNTQYYQLKLEELRLVYEYQEKLAQEKEEQRLIKEQIREEEKARREAELAEKEAEAEAKRYSELLERAKQEISAASDSQLPELQSKIELLEKQLEEANALKERAISLAQQTKTGHVYIISNIGSFGEDIYKIGMTRRMDPMDRVKELGDASVPFEFDVHAMIPTNDAPALENKLHNQFNNRRINMVNERKEFFKVSLTEIENAVKEFGLEIEFTKIAEAKQYRETLVLLKKLGINTYNN